MCVYNYARVVFPLEVSGGIHYQACERRIREGGCSAAMLPSLLTVRCSFCVCMCGFMVGERCLAFCFCLERRMVLARKD